MRKYDISLAKEILQEKGKGGITSDKTTTKRIIMKKSQINIDKIFK